MPQTATAAPTRKSRGGLFAALALLVLIAAAGGGYVSGVFDGFLGPKYPVAEPFSLIVEAPAKGPARAVGYVPSEQVQGKLGALMRDRSGEADLTLATGDIAGTWGEDVLAALAPLGALDDWRMVVSGNRAQVTGSTTDPATRDRVAAIFADGLPGALEGRADIALTEVFLPASELQSILDVNADCGPLTLVNPPVTGYGPETPVTVVGRVAGTTTRVGLFDALRDRAGGRSVVLDVEVLNPTLCLIEAHLPRAPQGGIGVAFTVGDRDEPNPSGRFFVGENPVIDVTLPADVTDGYLTVSVLDVSGNVFHLLPNINRQDNSVAALRGGVEGPASVRVAFSVQDAAQTGLLAFRVDDSVLGKSKIIVLHSAKPLFDGLRPTQESAVGFAEALQDRIGIDAGNILSLDSRILETARP